MHPCAGDLYQQVDICLTGLGRGLSPRTADGALAALHIADLALWLQPRAPFVRELRLRLPSDMVRAARAECRGPTAGAGAEDNGGRAASAERRGSRAGDGMGDKAVEDMVAACSCAELVSIKVEGRCATHLVTGTCACTIDDVCGRQ